MNQNPNGGMIQPKKYVMVEIQEQQAQAPVVEDKPQSLGFAWALFWSLLLLGAAWWILGGWEVMGR